MTGIPLLMDVDTGVDDAMAIALATRLDRHELVAVTTVAGNVPITNTTPNTLRVLEWMDANVPVYRGMHAPLARPLLTAGHVHGNDGLGGWDVPGPTRSIEDTTAPEAIVRLARQHAGEIVFAFVGPLTNLAVALMLEPELPDLVDRLVIMGGAFFNPGNVTADAEFNIYVDPEAAALVAASNFNATWIGLDVTHQTVLDRQGWDGLASSKSGADVLVREVCRQAFEGRKVDRVHLHDPLAVAVVEEPDLVESVAGEINVEVGFHVAGRTRVSPQNRGRGQAARSVDVDAFHRIFSRLLGS
ncbi:MAG: nucleoside hydrolase [Thermomicrobiales bacterium]